MENYENEGYSSLLNLNQNFDSQEYYETMLPYTMIKVTKPYTNDKLRQEIVHDLEYFDLTQQLVLFHFSVPSPERGSSVFGRGVSKEVGRQVFCLVFLIKHEFFLQKSFIR